MKLSRIRELCNEASPGPWTYDWGNWEVEGPRPERKGICDFPDGKGGAGSRLDAPADGEFIAASRTVVPKLLDIAQEAKHVCSILHLHGVGFIGMQLEEMIEDLETT